MDTLEQKSESLDKGLSAKIVHWQWLVLAGVILLGFGLRVHKLSQIFYELDESDFFNERIYANPPNSLIDYAILTKATTTHTWGWPAIMWTACHLFGRTLLVARMPSVIIGTAAILLMFGLVYRLLLGVPNVNRFMPSLFAALFIALAMPQVVFSQRTYPYAPVPFIAAALLLAHIELLRAASAWRGNSRGLLKSALLYAITGAVALFMHPSLYLLLAASLCLLAVPMLRYFLACSPPQRVRAALFTIVMGMLIFGSALINKKDDKMGFRTYLVPYYHGPSLHSIPRLLMHTYDLITYHLNLFYNTSLYWPEKLNVVILPLALLCLLGFCLAIAGKYGTLTRHLALLAVVAIGMPAGLSMFRRFPFGGLRQTLFLSPFLFVFAALGFYAFRTRPVLRVAACTAAVFYLVLWAVNLPRFYNERLETSADIVRVWHANGELPIYGWAINDRVLGYYAHEFPDVPIRNELLWAPKHVPDTRQPFLMIAPPLTLHGKSEFRPYLRSAGFDVIVLDEGPGKHPESNSYKTCLYYPPNGFWFYKVVPVD